MESFKHHWHASLSRKSVIIVNAQIERKKCIVIRYLSFSAAYMQIERLPPVHTGPSEAWCVGHVLPPVWVTQLHLWPWKSSGNFSVAVNASDMDIILKNSGKCPDPNNWIFCFYAEMQWKDQHIYTRADCKSKYNNLIWIAQSEKAIAISLR